MKTSFLRLAMIVALMMTIQACGNKGDLYLPDKDQNQQNTGDQTPKPSP